MQGVAQFHEEGRRGGVPYEYVFYRMQILLHRAFAIACVACAIRMMKKIEVCLRCLDT